MGAGQSLGPSPVVGSRVLSPASGLNGEVRGNVKYPDLVASAFPEVMTMYDAFQCVLASALTPARGASR